MGVVGRRAQIKLGPSPRRRAASSSHVQVARHEAHRKHVLLRVKGNVKHKAVELDVGGLRVGHGCCERAPVVCFFSANQHAEPGIWISESEGTFCQIEPSRRQGHTPPHTRTLRPSIERTPSGSSRLSAACAQRSLADAPLGTLTFACAGARCGAVGPGARAGLYLAACRVEQRHQRLLGRRRRRGLGAGQLPARRRG